MIENVLLGDCLELMKDIPAASVDMILCDLPYGTTANKWDSIIPFDDLWEQYERIIKDNGAIVLFAQTPFDKVLGASNLKLLRYEWIWEKENATGFLQAKKAPMKKHENILVFYKKLPFYNPQMRTGFKKYSTRRTGQSKNYREIKPFTSNSNGDRYPISILKFKRDKERIHPTQKPIDLLKYLIKTYTKEGELVLDNCCGSGSTLIAAKQTNRQFIGIEKEKEYYEVTLKRLRNVQLDLFV